MTQTPVSNLQASLTLTEFVDIVGIYPSRDGGGSGPFLGSIGIFAGPEPFIFDAPAEGQILSIEQNTALFSILGTDFGGNGINNFALPNLGGLEMIGAGGGPGLSTFDLGETVGQTSYDLTTAQLPPSLGGTSAPIDNYQPSLAVNYVINTEGIYPADGLTLNSLGVVSAFLGNFAPTEGELLCDGQLLSISQNTALFSLLGTTYGGNGVTDFALPDLRGRDIVGSGDGFLLGQQVGTANVNLTNANSPLGSDAPINNQQPGLVLNYYIALTGIYPSEGVAGNTANQQTPFIGQIVASAANIPDPNGWALCDGQSLSISQNTALFSLLGTTYGGNGTTNFALPDLEGRTVLGSGGSNGLGTAGEDNGANTVTLTSDNVGCYVTGTRILTNRGDVEVERLKVGDLLVTTSGESKPIKWIGRRKVAARFADPLQSWPVRIKASALSDAVPSRDLLLSPDHAILVNDLLIQAGALVNGTSIIRETNVPETFFYFHVELDDHSLILAENAPAETFVDNVDRMAFDNWAEHEALLPGGNAITEMHYPRAKAQRQVPRCIREELAERGMALYCPPAVAA
jgi:microcystin-dependent protein